VIEVALWRRRLAEFLGSAFLAAVVIDSGIAAQRLSPGDTGLELLENAAATAAGLYVIILTFGPVSGGHFNPVVRPARCSPPGACCRGRGSVMCSGSTWPSPGSGWPARRCCMSRRSPLSTPTSTPSASKPCLR
jgi:hypothetical protein